MPIITYHIFKDSREIVFLFCQKKGGGKLAKLTLKQRKFADEYIISGNATESYKRAYPSVKKDSTANTNASRMLRNAKVKSYIDERLKEIESAKTATRTNVNRNGSRIPGENIYRRERQRQIKSCRLAQQDSSGERE